MGRDLRVLIIDDEQACLSSIEMQLYNSKFKAILANNAFVAIEKIKESESDIDLILLDLMMPGMDGFEFLDELKKKKLFRNRPIIVQTGITDSDQIQKAIDKGCVDYLTKPFEKKDLLAVIEKNCSTFLCHTD